jgi:hypothetical protein
MYTAVKIFNWQRQCSSASQWSLSDVCFEQQSVKEFLVAGKELVRNIGLRQQQQHWLLGQESDGFHNQSRVA